MFIHFWTSRRRSLSVFKVYILFVMVTLWFLENSSLHLGAPLQRSWKLKAALEDKIWYRRETFSWSDAQLTNLLPPCLLPRVAFLTRNVSPLQTFLWRSWRTWTPTMACPDIISWGTWSRAKAWTCENENCAHTGPCGQLVQSWSNVIFPDQTDRFMIFRFY